MSLMWAERAVKHVENVVKLGAANKPIDVYHTGRAAPGEDMNEKVRGLRAKLPTLINQIKLTGNPVKIIDLRAKMAGHIQMGNCMEQAAVAFDYLRTTGQQTKMAYLLFDDKDYNEGAIKVDHAIVVLCLDKEPPRIEEYVIGSSPPESWGENAVVCDPWYHEWFVAATDLTRRLDRILRSTTNQRVKQGSKVKVECFAYV